MEELPNRSRRHTLRRLVAGGLAVCTFIPAARRAWGRPDGTAGAPLILVDAGHGGHDPGTMSDRGTMEKSVTLSSALALKAALEAAGFPRVALTRDSDRFVTLEDRAALAGSLDASLLVSLHADWTQDRAIRGASVYTLAAYGSDREADALARRENGAPGGPDQDRALAPAVADILSDLAGRASRADSARLAHEMIRRMEDGLPILFDPERQANFSVLHTANIPAVLVEMGFLSNTDDETVLTDPSGQRAVATAIAQAVGAWAHPRSNV